MANYKLAENGVIHVPTGLSIPADPLNRHWRDYLAWLVAGNTPDPADQPTPEQLARANEREQAPLTAKQFFASNPAAVAFVRLTPEEQAVRFDAMTTDQKWNVVKYLMVAVCADIKREFL